MNEKQDRDRRIKEIRKENLIQKEIELQNIEKSRKKVGSKQEIDSFIQRVQVDIRNRTIKAERKRQQKSISDEAELDKLFKPKTNTKVNEKVMGYYHQHRPTHTGFKYDPTDYITFEDPKPFNQEEFDFANHNFRNTGEVGLGRNEVIMTKQPLEEQKLKRANSKSNKTLNHATECATSFTTTYETNLRGRNKNIKQKTKSGVKSGIKSPKSQLSTNKPHKAWSEYINNIKTMTRSSNATDGEQMYRKDTIDTNELPVKYLDDHFAQVQ